MIQPPERLSVLDSHDVLYVLDNTYHAGIALRVGAYGTSIRVTYVMTHMTVFYLTSQLADGIGKTLYLFIFLSKYVQYEP